MWMDYRSWQSVMWTLNALALLAMRSACAHSSPTTRCRATASLVSSAYARRRDYMRARRRRGARLEHVITETPMAISLQRADRLVCACDDAAGQHFVVQNRLNPPIQLVKRANDKDALVGCTWRTLPPAGSDPAYAPARKRSRRYTPYSVFAYASALIATSEGESQPFRQAISSKQAIW